jgi:hypothetical protein
LPPEIDPPALLPVERDEKRVFLKPAMWRDLEDTAAFHSEAYSEMGIKGTVSRNDLVEGFLDWALESFWKDKNGRPKNAADRKKKVAAFADQLKAKLAARAANSDDNQNR